VRGSKKLINIPFHVCKQNIRPLARTIKGYKMSMYVPLQRVAPLRNDKAIHSREISLIVVHWAPYSGWCSSFTEKCR